MINLAYSDLSDGFARLPRSVRIMAEDDFLVIDVIPSKLSDQPNLTNTADPLWKLTAGTREIVQSTNLLRIIFDNVLGCFTLQEGAEAPSEMHKAIWGEVRRDRSVLPIFAVEGSPWRKAQPEWRHGENLDVKHYVIASETMLLDVLASVSSSRWMPNTRLTIDSWYDEELS